MTTLEATFSLRRQPSRFDQQPSGLSLATASCCCCCCCCLASTTAALSYSVMAPLNESRRNNVSAGPAVVTGVLSLPIGFITGFAVLGNGFTGGSALALVVVTGMFGLAGLLAGTTWGRFAARGFALCLAFAGASTLEIGLVLVLFFGLGPIGIVLWSAGAIAVGIVTVKAMGTVARDQGLPGAGPPSAGPPGAPPIFQPPRPAQTPMWPPAQSLS